jgi:serine/threonine protein kinase
MQSQLIAGRYEVLRAIGRGGMGTVWLCRDEVLSRQVAVKQIGSLPGESANEAKRALREARAAAALNHPNAVAIYDVVNHDARPWLVMEYVEGQTLADEISRDGRLSPRRVADIGAQLAGALARAHERRIVHRDIKPANVLIDKAGRPKISDFGIARGHGDDQLTAIGFVTGTPGYLSPELARGGDPHSGSDVWALGATLYAAVEGQSPYEPRSNPIALLRAIATQRPRPMTHAGSLGPVIDAMMYDDPARRLDMATCAKRLRGIADVASTAVMPRADAGAPAVVPPVDPAVTLALASQVVEPTQRLAAAASPVDPTRRFDSSAPSVGPTQRVAVAASPLGSTMPYAVTAGDVDEAQRLGPVKPPVEQPLRLEASAPLTPPDGRGSRRRWQPLAYAALLVAALGVAYLLTQLGDQGGTTALRATTSATTPAGSSTGAAPDRTTAADGSGSAEPPSTSGRGHKNVERFVSSYYSSVTKDTDRTWDQLTPRMQDAAGGRGGYDSFWKTIDKVKVNQIREDASGRSAVVSLTFTRDDGTTSTETHQFTFVSHDGDYLIESDQFLS